MSQNHCAPARTLDCNVKHKQDLRP